MKKIITLAVLALLPAVSGRMSGAQNLSDIQEEILAESNIQTYIESLSEISKSLSSVRTREALEQVKRDLAVQDLRFDTYFSAHSGEFADSEPIMDAVASYRESRSALDKDLAEKTAVLDAEDAVSTARECLNSADSTYSRYLKQARRYSLTKQSAKLLKKVKAREQADFARIQAAYSAAAGAVDAAPELKKSFEALEDKFANISASSELIQSMEYKPFVQRIKDYLISLAAVAILLMFFNMVQSRISSAKKMKESMKKMQETMNMNDQDIPSI